MGNRLLALLATVCAAALAAGCGAARHVPRAYPGPPPPVVAPVPESAPEPGAPPGEPGAAPLAASGDAIATFARSLEGVPYANGGSDLEGFDCSGFVQYVFARAGLQLPRSVREQFEAGDEVDGPVEAGDLVFFAIDGGRVSHVGIASGADTFVHAPSSRGVVREDRLSSPYWSRRYAGARRVRVR